MSAATDAFEKCDSTSARRLIRSLWNREERDRRQRLAYRKQQELWRLLETSLRSGIEKEPTAHTVVL